MSVFQYLFDRDDEAGETIFHELAKLGALRTLWRIHKRTTEPFVDLLSSQNWVGDLCIHEAANYQKGFRAIDLIDVLVRMGANLNASNSCAGETVLHRAAYRRNYELAEWLCQQPQVNLDARNFSGLTAYQIAYKSNDEQMKEIFRKAGADCEEPEETSSEESDG